MGWREQRETQQTVGESIGKTIPFSFNPEISIVRIQITSKHHPQDWGARFNKEHHSYPDSATVCWVSYLRLRCVPTM